MGQKDIVQVRVELEGELLEKVDAIKKFYGLEKYTEVFRLLINERYRLLEVRKLEDLEANQ